MKQEQKYTVITGASSGIGHSSAIAFANRGKNLIIIARRTERLYELKKEILRDHPSLTITIRVCDLSVIQNVYSLYEELKEYNIETWINNAGFGDYNRVATQNLAKVQLMLQLNIEALTILSTLYVHDYCNVSGTQLINISSGGGYTIVPTATTYCASKFYVSAFTEGLAHELKSQQMPLQAKVLAPAATQTEFGKLANNVTEYDYDEVFGTYHTSEQMADSLMQLYDSDHTVGIVDRETHRFNLTGPLFHYAGNSKHNQKTS